VLLGISAVVLAEGPGRSTSDWTFPLIAEAGGIRSLPRAAEAPRAGTRVVFDITKLADPAQPAKGVDRMARLLNLYADHQVDVAATGSSTNQPRFALVLHGSATVAALDDEAYRRYTKVERNPNLPLLRKFRQLGVEVFVCGQALAHQGYPQEDVSANVTIAVSAMNVLINKQHSGYAYLPFH
jgi:intracellular sulfur oxidation DsrE/DsrF family protein